LIDLLQEALAGLPEEDSALRARLLGRLAAAVYWVAPRDERARLAQDALDMARRTDDAEALLAALANYHYAVWGPEDLESQLAAATEIAEVADRVGLPEQALEGRILRIVDLFTLGRLETVHEEIDAVVVRAEELRQPSYRWQAANLVAMRALLEGRFDDAERLSAEALAIGEQAQDPNAIVLWGTQMAWLWRDRGATAELEVAMHGIVETFGAIPAAQAGLAWIAIELGRFDDARTAFERLAANDFDDLPRDIAWLVGVCILADTCTALGDVERAGTLYGLLWPYAALNVMTWINFCAGPVDHYLGLLAATRGQTEQAIGHFESALAMGVALGARPRTARTQFAYARVLLARDQPGDAARARQLLAAAGLTASELDMRPLAAQVAALASEL
jgi:tetratricopeptide (TPR) repeat protein